MPNNSYELITQFNNLAKSLISKNPDIQGFIIKTNSLQDFKKKYNPDFFTTAEISSTKNRLQSLAGRYLAKMAIREIFNKEIPFKELEIISADSGQPVLRGSFRKDLKNSEISLSITHEAGIIIAGAMLYPKENSIALGIDVAEISRFEPVIANPKVMEKIFTSSEITQIKSPVDAAKLWASKEAVSKALGMGVWHGGVLLDIQISNLKKNPSPLLSTKLIARQNLRSDHKFFMEVLAADKYVLTAAIAKNAWQ